MAKISVSIPDDLLAEVTVVAGKGGVSAYLSESALKRIRRERRRELLLEMLEETGGPPTPEEIEEARAWMRSSSILVR